MDVNEKSSSDRGTQVPDAVSEFVQAYHPSVAAALYGGSHYEDWFQRSLLAGLMRLEQLGCVRLGRSEDRDVDSNGNGGYDGSDDDSARGTDDIAYTSADTVTVEFLTASACKDSLDKETYFFLASFKARDVQTLELREVASFAANFPDAFQKRAGLWRKAVLATPAYQSCYLPQGSPGASADERTQEPASFSIGTPLVLYGVAALVFLLQPLGGVGSLVLAIAIVLVALAMRKKPQPQGGTQSDARGGTQDARRGTLQEAHPTVDPYVSPERAAFFDGCEKFRAWCGSPEASRTLAGMGDPERIALCAMTVALDCAIEPAFEEAATEEADPGTPSASGTPASGTNNPANRGWDDDADRGRGGIDWFDVWFALNAFDLAHHMFGGHTVGDQAFGGYGDVQTGSGDASAWSDATSTEGGVLSGGFASADEGSGYASGGFTSEDHTQLTGGFSSGEVDSGGFGGGFGGGFSDGAGRGGLSGGFGGGERDSGGFGGDSSGGDTSSRGSLFAGGLFGSLFGANLAADASAADDGFSSDAPDGDFDDSGDFGGSDDGGFFGGFGDFGGSDDSGGFFDSFDFGDFGDFGGFGD